MQPVIAVNRLSEVDAQPVHMHFFNEKSGTADELLAHDLFPRPDIGRARHRAHAMDLEALVLHALQLGEQRAEQLQLARIADLAVRRHRFDLREQEVFGGGVARELVEALVPGDELGIVVGEAVHGLLQLDEPPDRERVVVLLGTGALEMKQRGLVLATIIQQVRKIDTGFAEARVELERAAQPVEAAALVREPVRGVADTGGCIGGVGMRPQRTFEETARLIEHAFAEQGAPDLQHEIVVVLEAEREHLLETCERSRALSELEQHLA